MDIGIFNYILHINIQVCNSGFFVKYLMSKLSYLIF